ncbi:glycosyltransferase family 4 protein [Chloroflexota bacterium]
MRALVMMSGIAMGGAERNIVSVLPYIKEQGVDVRLLTLNTRRDSPLTDEFNQTGLTRHDLAAQRMLDPTAWQRFTHLLKSEQIDIIHAEDQDTIVYAAVAHRLLGIPSVMSRHVLQEPSDTLKESVRAQLVLLAARVGFDRILAVSEAVRQQFSGLARVPVTRIETIYNGIQLERFQTGAGRAAKRQELGWAAADPVVIMVAVLRRGKGHEVLFEALPRIQAAVPNVKIKLVGDGELRDTLQEQAAPYGEAVEFMGQRMDVPELLGASDALVLPSWSEALPTVLIEAGAASLPLVATDVGGSAEIVADGETGYIVQPGVVAPLADRLIDLLADPQQAQLMGQRAYERVNQLFSLEQQARQTVALYEKVLADK